MTDQVQVRYVRPTGRKIRVQLEGATCARCQRELKRGAWAVVDAGRLVHPKDVPCLPAWLA